MSEGEHSMLTTAQSPPDQALAPFAVDAAAAQPAGNPTSQSANPTNDQLPDGDGIVAADDPEAGIAADIDAGSPAGEVTASVGSGTPRAACGHKRTAGAAGMELSTELRGSACSNTPAKKQQQEAASAGFGTAASPLRSLCA